MVSSKGIFVVAGVGNGSGTGAASAGIFASAGYKVALIARNADSLNKLADELKASGHDVSTI
jgi:NADP-dependent 3-hydroxy acid dehydrogenase YdfG